MKYESIFIVSPNQPETKIDEIIKNVEEQIAKSKGTVLDVERWGKKRLAYPINKNKYGFYVLVRFEAPASLISSLERYYRLKEYIIKFLTIKLLVLKKKSDSGSSPIENDDKTVKIEADTGNVDEKKELKTT